MDKFTIHTLFDITATNTVNQLDYRKKFPKFTQSQWEFSRNQQRNWEAIIQLLGLRSQPTILSKPIILTNKNPADYKFGHNYAGFTNVNIWCTTVQYDYNDLFRVDDDPAYLIKQDFEEVPLITKLHESLTIEPARLITSGPAQNVHFTHETDK
jgi:hypothetical protein